MKYTLMTKAFSRWAKKAELEADELLNALLEISKGLYDAKLGNGIYKKRIPLQGRGKRGGARTIVVTNQDDRWIFITGYSKNEQENLSKAELEFVKKTGAIFLELTQIDLEKLIKVHELEII